MGDIRIVFGSFIVSSTATVAAPTSSRTPYGAEAMDPRLPQPTANAKLGARAGGLCALQVGRKYAECHAADYRHGDSRCCEIGEFGSRRPNPQTSAPGGTARLLCGCGSGRRDGRTRAGEAWCPRLRSPRDRAQPARG